MSKPIGALLDRDHLPLNQDYGSYEGAGILADRIRAYWVKRGHGTPRVQVVADMSNRSDRKDRYNVRSDMIGGWP